MKVVYVLCRLYVDNFVFFSEAGAEEERFQRLLFDNLKVDFMVEANLFLGQTFKWNCTPNNGGINIMIN